MAKEKGIVLEGIVEEVNGFFFKIRLGNGMLTQAYLSGNIRRHFIRTIPGDKILVEVSPYDLTRGRIIFRERNAKK